MLIFIFIQVEYTSRNMTTVIRDYPGPKPKMSVAPVQWLPGALSAMLPFFAVTDVSTGHLYMRGDDPNIYGVNYTGLQNTPVVEKATAQKAANKGYNFYSAPWCIPTLPSRDLGKRVWVTSIDDSVFNYITALYNIVGTVPIQLEDWELNESGYVKLYQVLQGSAYVNVGGATYFGGAKVTPTQVNGISSTTAQTNPLITDDFTFNSPSTITTYLLPYNTYYAVDTPIVISAKDVNHPEQPRIYFTLLNNATIYNGPNN